MRVVKVKRPRRIKVVRKSPVSTAPVQPSAAGSLDLDGFYHLHAHSQYSVGDAISPVEQMIETAVRHGQRALALTDHGNMGGVVQLYQGAKKHGIKPFPGIEAYLVEDKTDKESKEKRFHVGLVAFTTKGYRDLVRIASNSGKRENFHRKPLIDLTDLAEFKTQGMTDGIALTTGCYFGYAIQALVNKGPEELLRILSMYRAWFPHTYVEIQNHNIDHEDHWSDQKIIDEMVSAANELGLPMVITQDAHYCDLEEQPLHNQLKQLVAFGPDPDDAKFPGDGFHLCHEQWMKDHHSEEQFKLGMEGLNDLYEKHDLLIPQLEKYHYNVPTTVSDPLDQIKTFCGQQIVARELPTKGYMDRLSEEIDVIEASGMAGYLWLVKEVTDWCRNHGVFYTARGSASGSLVCWLLGITQLDPIKYKLRFDRFLSKDRTKPPDIDLDVEDVRREDLIEWLKKRFNVCHIGTYGTFSLYTDTGRGSLFVQYLSKQRKLGEDVEKIKSAHDIPKQDFLHLKELSDQEVRKSYGTHAAGLVVTSTREEFESLVPTMLVASSNTTVTQLEGDDVEALGLVKLDVLGQRNLTTLRRTVELLGRDVSEGFEWIPLNDKETFKMVRKGKTGGVFQLEGWTASKGCKEMKTKSLKDVIHILALYRPGVMSSGTKDSYIRRKEGAEKVNYLHPMFEKHFKETYGLPIFQEQTVGVLRELGFDPEDLTKFLKAVKSSNKKVESAKATIAGYQKLYTELADKAGFSDEAKDWMWNVIEGFAEYGFNKAHAAAYGIQAVRMAYLKANHPLEFATALLETSAGSQKEKEYKRMVHKELGIPLLKPHVNISGASYTIDHRRSAIRRGISSIKGVGSKAAIAIEEVRGDGEFSSVQDFCDRLIEAGHTRSVTGIKNPDDEKGTLGFLMQMGALDGLDGVE